MVTLKLLNLISSLVNFASHLFSRRATEIANTLEYLVFVY